MRQCRSSAPLPRGGSYVLDPDPTVGSAAIGLWFRAPGAGYDNATPGISNLAATAAAVAPLASGKSLYALVHTVGGELNIQVYPDIIGIAAVVPATSARPHRSRNDGRLFCAVGRRYGRQDCPRKRRRARRAGALRVGCDAARFAFRPDLRERTRTLSAAADVGCAADQHFDGAGERLCQTRFPRGEWGADADRQRRRLQRRRGYRRLGLGFDGSSNRFNARPCAGLGHQHRCGRRRRPCLDRSADRR